MLQAVRHFVLAHARSDLGVRVRGAAQLVEAREVVQKAPPCRVFIAFRVRKVEHGVGPGPELHALMPRRHEPARPLPVGQRLGVAHALRHHHHESRQVFVLAPEPVRNPGSDAGSPGELESGLEKGDRRIVVDGIGLHAADHTDVIGDARRVRQQFTQPLAALPVPVEPEDGRRGRKLRLIGRHTRESLPLPNRIRQLLAAPRRQVRLVVEHVELRRCAVLKEIDDALSRGREMGKHSRRLIFRHQRRERSRSQRHARKPEKIASVHCFVTASSRFMIRLATVA